MARRNIFDRDTRAGDYSDTLGNFLENIPSIYGQLAKEKRLEKQYQDEKNFRTTQYNNQLLQQARNNKINADKTTRAEEWQDFQKEDKEFNNRLKMAELASINNPGAVDSFLLSEGVITQEDFNSRKSINNDYSDLITDVDGYINMTVNDQFDNYHDATDMYNRLNQKLTVLKPNSPMAKTLRDEKNKLNKSLNFIKTKSGQVRPKSEWSSPADAVLYNQLTLDLNDYNKQLREIDAQITKAEASKLGNNTLLPLYAARDALQVETKDSFGKKGYEGSIPKTITELAMMGSKYKYPSIPDKPTPGEPTQSSGLADATDDDRDKIIEERNKFINSVEPLLRDDEAGLDALLDYYRDEGDESFSRVESTADILKKQLDAKAPKILGIVPDVSNEDFAGNEGDFRIIDNQPQVADPVVAEGGEPELEPNPEVVKTEPVVTEPNDTVLPTLSADSPVQQFSQGIARDASLPPIDMGQQREEVLQEAEKYDVPAIPETGGVNPTTRYIGTELLSDLDFVISERKELKKIEDRNSQSIRKDYKPRKNRLSKIEKDIKSKIGKFINPVSGDISISNQNYKNQIFNRLEKKFGEDLYFTLASLSNIKK